jgi:hypothetical protein
VTWPELIFEYLCPELDEDHCVEVRGFAKILGVING